MHSLVVHEELFHIPLQRRYQLFAGQQLDHLLTDVGGIHEDGQRRDMRRPAE